MTMRILIVLCLCHCLSLCYPLLAEEPLAGHSMHGEAFNEGPRQAAYLMEGMGNVQFEVSTSHGEARKFFNQGVAQLHGFWYYEAERSFRQAASLDPNCPMFYWGMALANVNNGQRASAFIAQAIQRKANASPRELMYIEAAERRFGKPDEAKAEAEKDKNKDQDKDQEQDKQKREEEKKAKRKATAETYTRDLEAIVLKYPEDIEARALLALQLWENERSDVPIVSHVAVNSILQDIFDKNPMHPAHHYRIHLWDHKDPSQALHSAALCGPSLPGIAHMWHMPGHTYSNLNRFHDAVWQQEASARVDHAHMMRDRLMPDQIHNFAHNNEWTIRNLVKIGRVQDAINLATNMIQLPRHPKFNSLDGGSARYGRERLVQTLAAYRLWPQMLDAYAAGLVELGDKPNDQVQWLRHRGIAEVMAQRAEEANKTLADLKSRLNQIEEELRAIAAEEQPQPVAQRPDEGVPPAPCPPSAAAAEASPVALAAPETAPAANDSNGTGGPKPAEATACQAEPDPQKAQANQERRQKERQQRRDELNSQRDRLSEAIAAIEAAQAAAGGNWSRALELFDKAGEWDKLLKIEWLAKADKIDEALKLMEEEVKANPGTVLPLAVSAWVRWQTGGAKAARDDFEALRAAACVSELSTPMLARLEPLAAWLGYDKHWARPYQPANDIGARPELDKLGPFRYSPYQAVAWQAKTRAAEAVASDKYAGKPVIVIFYLGFGCLHCMEQLQKFSPAADKFRQAGIELVAISNETPEVLAQGIDKYDKPLNVPLLSDGELKVFKEFRCFDDFEKQPLHGTFLIDAQGRVLWQDIGYEPFQDEEFLLKEATRLLKVTAWKGEGAGG